MFFSSAIKSVRFEFFGFNCYLLFIFLFGIEQNLPTSRYWNRHVAKTTPSQYSQIIAAPTATWHILPFFILIEVHLLKHFIK